MKSRRVVETATRSNKYETIVEGQRLRKADIMESKCSRQRFACENEQKSDADMETCTSISLCTCTFKYVYRDLESMCDTHVRTRKMVKQKGSVRRDPGGHNHTTTHTTTQLHNNNTHQHTQTDRDLQSVLSKSISATTRKTVNYA